MNSLLSLLTALVSITLSATAAQYTVSVRVGGDDPGICNLVNSYVKRELRALNDVTVEDEPADYTIDLIAAADTLTTGRTVGYSISVVVSSPPSPFLTNLVNATNSTLASGFFSNYRKIETHQLRGGADLQALCRTIVASFDTEQLDADRKLYSQMRHIIEGNRKK